MAKDGAACDDGAMKQTSFASAEYAGKKRQTRRERFLAEMNTVVPWTRLEALIEPHYPKSGKVGRPPIGVPRMLRMYFLQQWYTLADEALEDVLYDSQAMREFIGIDLGSRERARRHHAAEVPPAAGAARPDVCNPGRGQCALDRARLADAPGHGGGRHHHRRPEFDQE
jgi:hypothetical protein